MTDNRKIAHTLLDVVGGKPRVVEYSDNAGESVIDIFVGENRPQDGVTTYSTIGLSAFPIGLKTDKQLRVEFIGACYSDADKFGNIISSCAFNIINSKFSCKPGTVYPNVVREYYPQAEMAHVLFADPFLWDAPLRVEFDEAVAIWLLAVPISDGELDFLQKEGSDALRKMFVEKNIDIFDINRVSVADDAEHADDADRNRAALLAAAKEGYRASYAV